MGTPPAARAAAVPGSALPAVGTGQAGRTGAGHRYCARHGTARSPHGHGTARAHHDRVSPERGAPPRKPVPAAAGAGRSRSAATGVRTGAPGSALLAAQRPGLAAAPAG